MNFRELLRSHGVVCAPSDHHHARDGWVQFDCPYCSPRSNRWRMGYNEAGKYINCWVCGRHRLIDTVSALTGLTIGQAFKAVGWIETGRAVVKKQVIGKLVVPFPTVEHHSAHERYLRGRGFKFERIAKLWSIGCTTHHAGQWKWRIFIPIHYCGEIVSWTTRSISDSGVRYISASPDQEKHHHKELLYGEDYCRHGIIVHEGSTDVWSTGPGSVATLGVGYTRAQLLRIAKYPTRAICFDSEPDAQKRARRLLADLSVFPGETSNIVLESGKDSASADRREVKQLRRMFL